MYIDSRRFTDHEDTVLIKSSKTDARSEVRACVRICVYAYVCACIELRGTE